MNLYLNGEGMKFLKVLSASALLPATLMIATNSLAADGWKSSVEVGFLLTDGNTETQSTNVKGAAAHETASWKNEATLEALNVKGKEGRLSEKYLGSGKSAMKFSEASYAFLTASGEHDPFSGYAYQVNASLGYGHSVIKTDRTSLDFEGGPGLLQTRLRGVDEAESEGVLRLSGKYVQKLSKTSEFSEELTSSIGENTTITKSITALSAQIAGSMSMKVSLTVKNNSNTPVEVEATDTETAVTLVYSFE